MNFMFVKLLKKTMERSIITIQKPFFEIVYIAYGILYWFPSILFCFSLSTVVEIKTKITFRI